MKGGILKSLIFSPIIFTGISLLEILNILLKHGVINPYQKTTKSWQILFFLSGFSSQDSRRKKRTIFYSTGLLPPARKHWDIYLQFCLWDDCHVLLIATLVFTRLLLDDIYHLIEIPFEWLIDDAMFVCSLDELVLGFCYSDFILGTGGFELASTITLVLQAKSTNQVC